VKDYSALNPEFSNSVSMNTNQTLIKTATMSAAVKQVEGDVAIKMMDETRAIAQSAPGNCFAYESTFND
jgi:hypothetical protein